MPGNARTAAIARSYRKIPPLLERFWSKVEKKGPDECWPWTAAPRRKDQGYGAFWFKGRHRPAPRMAYIFTHGDISDKLEVCHRCDNPPCCNPKHLFTGTHQENNDDKVAKKRHAHGETNGISILKNDQVIEIRKLRHRYKLRELAEMFSVDFTTISDICRGKSWKHLL